MNRRPWPVAATAAAGIVGLLLSASPASASSPPAWSPTPDSVGTSAWADFNKDGFADLAIGAPYETAGGKDDAGAVHVIYGSAAGLDSGHTQRWSQASSGIKGNPETGDEFGFALAAGDFDGDGYGDLAIGIPHEDTTVAGHNHPDAGASQVLFGSSSGLTSRDSLTFAQTGPTDYALWGSSLAALDVFNSTGIGTDGRADLAVGLPGADGRLGSIVLLSGQAVTPGGSAGTKLEIDNTNPGEAHFGASMVAGDFDLNSIDDLAIAAPDGPAPDPAHPGMTIRSGYVLVLYNGTIGGDLELSEGSNGTPGSPKVFDGFGTALAVAHDSSSPYDSLFVGAPSYDAGGVDGSGMVFRFPGKGNGAGLDPAGETFHESTMKFSQPLKANDHFGQAIAVADFGFGSALDIAIGVPGHDAGATNAGAVMVSYDGGSSNNIEIDQGSSGIEGTPGPSDSFGKALFAANFGNGGRADLAVGVPLKAVSGQSIAGQVNVLYGSQASGLTGSNDQAWNQASTGISGSPAPGVSFGIVVN